jgi:hypothetical protein
MTSPTDAAARRIQRLWKRYRDAVESYEDAASSAGSTHEDLAEAAEVIQRRWREYLASTRRPAADASNRAGNDATTHERRDDDDDDGAAEAHAEETEANARDRRLDEIIATLRPPDMAPHDAAAMMIQMWWRVRGRETPSPHYDSTHDTSQSQSLDSAPSPAHRRVMGEGEDANGTSGALTQLVRKKPGGSSCCSRPLRSGRCARVSSSATSCSKSGSATAIAPL